MDTVLRRQIEPFFEMIEEALKRTSEELFHSVVEGYQFWKLIYHPLYWLHFHLSEERDFVPADFHTKEMHSLDVKSTTAPSRNQLREYLREVRGYIGQFIDSADLEESNEGPTKLDTFFGQIRHTAYHVGMLHTVILQETGEMLKTIAPKFQQETDS